MVKKKDWLQKVGEWLINQSQENDINEANKDNSSSEIEEKVFISSTDEPKKEKIEFKRKSILNELTIERAFRIFLLSWEDEGFSPEYFLNGREVKEILETLDQQFREELIEWLFKCSNEIEIIHDLEKIIKRKRALASDNINSIRAFSYISVLLNKNKFDIGNESNNENKLKEPEKIDFRDEKFENNASYTKDELFNASHQKEIELDYQTDNKQLEIYNSKQNNNQEILKTEFELTDKDSYLSNKVPLSDLEIRRFTYNTLRRGHLEYISDLIGMKENDFLALTNFGPTAFVDLEEALKKIGLKIPIYFDKEISNDQIDFNKTQSKYKHLKELSYDEEFWIQFTKAFRGKIINLDNILEVLDEFTEFGIEKKENTFYSNNSKGSIQTEFNIFVSSIKVEALRINLDVSKKNYLISLLFKKFISLTTHLDARKWIFNFKNLLIRNDKYLQIIFKRLDNISLAEIGKEYDLSRERVRQIESTFLKYLNLSSSEFRANFKEHFFDLKFKEEKELIEKYISNFEHLPLPEENNQLKDDSPFLQKISLFNPSERIEVYKTYDQTIPESEYDYHFNLITNQIGPVGNGYWLDFENLKKYLFKYAEYLGEPELMPKQVTLMPSPRGAVTRYGGQSNVAKIIGLKYQGQLVNENGGGRKYWTEERLNELLNDVNIFSKQDLVLMPSYAQILDFFKSTRDEKYHNKKSHSAIAALTKMGNITWFEVSQRFNRSYISGTSQKVTTSFIKAFVRDLGEHLTVLTSSELYVLFQAQGINRKEQAKFSRTFDVLIDAVQTGMVNKKDLEDWSNNLNVPSIRELLDLGSDVKKESKQEREIKLLERRSRKLRKEIEEKKVINIDEITKDDLPNLDPGRTLKALDKAAGVLEESGTDLDRIEFLKAKASAKLWDSCFKNENELISKLKSNKTQENTYSEEVTNLFLDEYYGAKNLKIPDNYKFKDLKGRERKPKLMQKLVSYRLLRDKRILNLSGTGTGKTLSAILAAQVCNSRRIFISCPNGVTSSWVRTFKSAYPEAILHVKPENWQVNLIEARTNVVVVNHERFQDRFSENLLGFCVDFRPDMVVIDEIHQSKRRTSDKSSQRRKLINEFIRISSNMNPEMRIIGLSATPVINNIYEGRSLIELVTQDILSDVKENDDLNSCMNLYQHFIVNGIRMNPGNLSKTKIIPKNIDVSNLLPEIINATKNGRYHEVERILVKPKLSVLKECISKGQKTVIFITLIKGTLIPITNWLKTQNLSFCVYTGEDKEATEIGFTDSLDEFIRGDTNVLVASVQCAGTGVDGLQSVCNKAVFFQLPWTSTEFEQSIGRLDRDGTEFDSIEVFLPLTNICLPNGEQWSWCHSKLDRIKSKKDIAKAAVDGEIPDSSSMISPQEASKYWLEWLKRLEIKK